MFVKLGDATPLPFNPATLRKIALAVAPTVIGSPAIPGIAIPLAAIEMSESTVSSKRLLHVIWSIEYCARRIAVAVPGVTTVPNRVQNGVVPALLSCITARVLPFP